jgi:hypothetical protein
MMILLRWWAAVLVGALLIGPGWLLLRRASPLSRLSGAVLCAAGGLLFILGLVARITHR